MKKPERYSIYIGVINEGGVIVEETPYFMDGMVAVWASQAEALDTLHELADNDGEDTPCTSPS